MLLTDYFIPQSFSQAIVALVAILVVYILYGIYIAPRLKLKRLGLSFPTPTAGSGNLNDFGIDNQHISQIEWHKRYGDVYATQFAHIPTIWISKLDTLKTIMVKDFDNFTNRYRFQEPYHPFDKSVTELKENEWNRIRNILIPTFATSNLLDVASIVKDASQEFIDRIVEADQSNEKLDVWESCGQLSMKIILAATIGVKIESKEQEEKLIKPASLIFRSDKAPSSQKQFLILIGAMPSTFRPWLDRKLSEAVNYMVDLTKSTISERRKNIAAGLPCRKDLLQHLIEIGDRNSLSDDEIISQIVTFLIAGFETTQNAICFVLYSLATNPEVQHKLMEEIATTCPDNELINCDVISQMQYLDMVISETLRLYPPTILTQRVIKKPMTIDEIYIPDDVMIGIPIYAIHHNPELWPQPEQFKPERFTAQEKTNRHPMAYIPFGSGRRNCIGMKLGLLQIKIAIVRILQSIEFVATKETETPLKLRSLVILSPVNPVYLGVKKRF